MNRIDNMTQDELKIMLKSVFRLLYVETLHRHNIDDMYQLGAILKCSKEDAEQYMDANDILEIDVVNPHKYVEHDDRETLRKLFQVEGGIL